MSEPLSNTCLLPYLYYLVRSLQSQTDTTPSSISRHAGFLVSLFALSQFFTSVPWSYCADRWGRKPVILLGLILSIISNVGFGFSKTIPGVMCWRVIAGIGNGNVGVMRTMTAEIVKEKKHQSRAFLMLPLVFNLGTVAGLAVGGILASPVESLPWLFGGEGILNISGDPMGVEWLHSFPFALPTLFNAATLTASLILASCSLTETLPKSHRRRAARTIELEKTRRFASRLRQRAGYEPINRENSSEEARDSNIELLPEKLHSAQLPRFGYTWTRDVWCALVSFALLPLHNSAFMQIFPVFLSTPPSEANGISSGGLGLSSSTIGFFLSAFGIFGILSQLLIYPFLQDSLGTLLTYRLALCIFPIAYFSAPYTAIIPASSPILQSIVITWTLCLQVTARTFAIPSSVILLTNSSPQPSALGSIHGTGSMLNSLCRAIGPAAGGVLFGLGAEQGSDKLIWWGYLVVISLAAIGWSWTLIESTEKI